MKIPEYISEMSMDEFLEALDDFGDGHHYIHEAARRIKKLQKDLEYFRDIAGDRI